jgi:hypothetical protein
VSDGAPTTGLSCLASEARRSQQLRRPESWRVTVGVPSERSCAPTLVLFDKKMRADSLLVIPRALAPVTPVQSDSFRNSSARSTDQFGSPIPKSRLHTQPISQMVIYDTLKLRPCTRSDRAKLRAHPSLRKKSFTRTNQAFFSSRRALLIQRVVKVPFFRFGGILDWLGWQPLG